MYQIRGHPFVICTLRESTKVQGCGQTEGIRLVRTSKLILSDTSVKMTVNIVSNVNAPMHRPNAHKIRKSCAIYKRDEVGQAKEA